MSTEGPRIVSDGFMNPSELQGRRALVLGLGVSGLAVAGALVGTGAVVHASDARPEMHADPDVERLRAAGVQIETGGHRRAARWLNQVDLVIPSPGISPRSGILATAIAEGVPVLSEIELAFRFASAPIIAVTGTNGKTTTARLIGDMLSADGRDPVVCGNIGRPFISAAMEHSDAGVFVVEVSSFQLTFCYAFHPQVSVITNVAPDHLDWHGSMDAYRVAKARIAARQMRNDWFIYPAAQRELASLAPSPGPRHLPFSIDVVRSGDAVWLDGDEIIGRVGSDVTVRAGSIAALRAKGRPFVEDGLAASAAALAFGVASDACGRAIASFQPDHHRIQFVGELEGVRFFDDSKATNPHATVAALRGFEPVVLIAGGRNKGLDLSALAGEARRLRAVVGFGEASADVASAFRDSGVNIRTVSALRDAVRVAFSLAVPGDVVLLSPACASFDQFEDYAMRGRAFQNAYAELAGAEEREGS